MAFYRTGGGSDIVEGTVTVSTANTTKVTLGFKPSKVFVNFYKDTTHFRLLTFDSEANSAAGTYITRLGSATSVEYDAFPSTNTGSIATIDNDGFTLCKISSGQSTNTPTTGTYVAMK